MPQVETQSSGRFSPIFPDAPTLFLETEIGRYTLIFPQYDSAAKMLGEITLGVFLFCGAAVKISVTYAFNLLWYKLLHRLLLPT